MLFTTNQQQDQEPEILFLSFLSSVAALEMIMINIGYDNNNLFPCYFRYQSETAAVVRLATFWTELRQITIYYLAIKNNENSASGEYSDNGFSWNSLM